MNFVWSNKWHWLNFVWKAQQRRAKSSLPPAEMPTTYERKKYFWGWKKYFGWKNSIFHFVSIEVYTRWSLRKNILRHFAQNHKYLQLEKSTKYCKKRNSWHLCSRHTCSHSDFQLFNIFTILLLIQYTTSWHIFSENIASLGLIINYFMSNLILDFTQVFKWNYSKILHAWKVSRTCIKHNLSLSAM